MGNLDSKFFRVCGSAVKQNKALTQELKEDEEDHVFFERNRDKYFQKGDYKKILEKFPEYKEWMEQSTVPFSREKPKQKRIRWKQGEVIGHGSFGKVMMGLNLQTGCMMAVKQVQIGTVNTAAQQERIKALEVEIEFLSQLSHKNIVRYYGSDSTNDSFNILLEYISGGTIASLLDKYGPFNENLIRVYTRQILQGLEYLHIRNTIHRDIKGANVLVDNSGICKLTDFGTAKRISSLIESDTKYLPSIRGTVNWMAPEVIRQTNLGRYCDIWSVGCTVIEMATGKAPWSTLLNSNATCVSLLYQIAQAKSPPPFPKGLSPEALDFLKQCFKINPQERPNVIKLLNHKFLSSVVFYKNIDLPRDPKQEIAPKAIMEQNIRAASDREKTTAADKYVLKRRASSSKEIPLTRDIEESPTIPDGEKIKQKLPPSRFKKAEAYMEKEEEEDNTPTPLQRPQLNRRFPSSNDISQREGRSRIEQPSEIRGLAASDLSEIESPAILHNLTDRLKTLNALEEEKEKPNAKSPMEARGYPESRVRSRPLGKNKRLLLKKGGYSNLSEDESIAGNSFMLMGSPEAIYEVNEDKGQSAGSNKGGNKSSLFKVSGNAFPWPENIVENDNTITESHRRIDEEKEEIIIESDGEQGEKTETEIDLRKSARKQQRRESLNNLSNASVHSNPEMHTIEEEAEENRREIMNKENLNKEFDDIFPDQRKPLSVKKDNQIMHMKSRTDTNLPRRLPNSNQKDRIPGAAYSSEDVIAFYGDSFSKDTDHWRKESKQYDTGSREMSKRGVRSEEEIRKAYKQPLTELDARQNGLKEKKLNHLGTPNITLISN